MDVEKGVQVAGQRHQVDQALVGDLVGWGKGGTKGASAEAVGRWRRAAGCWQCGTAENQSNWRQSPHEIIAPGTPTA